MSESTSSEQPKKATATPRQSLPKQDFHFPHFGVTITATSLEGAKRQLKHKTDKRKAGDGNS